MKAIEELHKLPNTQMKVRYNKLEDELVRCTDISRIQELTNSKSKKDFKRDFCAMTNCRQVLDRHNLDVELLWNSKFPEKFEFLEYNSKTVKTG